MYFVIGARDSLESAMPKLDTIAELGVLRGDHAAAMFAYHQPKSMVLVDTWSADMMTKVYHDVDAKLPHVTPLETYSDYFGGSPYEQATWDRIYQTVEGRFSGNPKVKIVRKITHRAAEDFPDAFFDLVYVDAGHPYNSVLYDLFGWESKVKPGGFMVLNDCASSPETRSQNGGVLEAAITFMKATKFRPLALSSGVWADLVLTRDPASPSAQHLQRELLLQNPDNVIEMPDEAVFSFNHKHVANPLDPAMPIAVPSFKL